MSTPTFQFCEDKLGHRGVQRCPQHDRCLVTASCYYRYFMFVPWISNDQSPDNNLLLNLQTQCPLDISTRSKLFIFSSKIEKIFGENSFTMLSETTCPPQRQLTHHHFLPPYPSITLFSSGFSRPLESTLFCLHCSYLVTCSWTPSINIFSSIFLP